MANDCILILLISEDFFSTFKIGEDFFISFSINLYYRFSFVISVVFQVDNQIMLLQENLELTEDDFHLRALLCQLLRMALDEVLPDCDVEQFGSSVSNT